MKNSIILLALALTMTVGYAQKEKEVVLNEDTNLLETTYFHDNGEVSQKGTFDLAGKLQGQWVSFDEMGEKVSVGNYNKGVRTGKWYFYNDGMVKEVEFDNNVIANVINKQTKSAVVSKD